jgi:hypothetical protein
MSPWWEVTGTIDVNESATTRDDLDHPLERRRPLSGVAVQVSVRANEHESFSVWTETRTEPDGRFRLRAAPPSFARHVRVSVLLVGEQLVVCGATPVDWITVLELDLSADGARASILDVGAISFRDGAAGEIGEQDHVRRAVTWYVARAAMEYLGGLGAGLSFNLPIVIRYPIVSPTGGSYACRVRRTAIIHRDTDRDDWSVERVLRQVMRLWSCQVAPARSYWPAETVESRHASATPVDRFADLATNELLMLLWDRSVSPARHPSG